MDSVEITIADVAQRAGVSVSTVSRILNNKPDVAESTRARVKQIIDELGFRPHTQAQRLAAGKSRTIAFLHPIEYLFSKESVVDTDFIIGAAAAAAEGSYMFNLVTIPVDENSLRGLYRSAQVDGVILMEIHLQDWRVDMLRKHNLPFTMVGHCANNSRLSYIDLDFENCVLAATDHLVDLGHRKIGFLTHSAVVRLHQYGPAVRSLRGYEMACEKYGLERHFVESGVDPEQIYQSTMELLDTEPELTAIITSAGPSAVGILRALAERGRSVPDDVSVIPFISEKFCQLITPSLTSIDLPAYSMGHQAAKMLIARLQQPDLEPEQILIPPKLVVRGSTAPPRSQ
jgi:DNA-binding LacI/PurR family transcriptional regulator